MMSAVGAAAVVVIWVVGGFGKVAGLAVVWRDWCGKVV